MAVKVSELPKATNASRDDLLIIIDSPAGGAVTKNITVKDFFSNVSTTVMFNNTVSFSNTFTANTSNTYFSNVHFSYSQTPTSSVFPGDKGQIWFDNDYIYVAVANNFVKRVAVSSF